MQWLSYYSLLVYYNDIKPSTTDMHTCSVKNVSIDIPSGNGVVRLFRNGVTSSSYYYGIVQILINGQWGNICEDHYYNKNEADVICHQLGYTGASKAPKVNSKRFAKMIE